MCQRFVSLKCQILQNLSIHSHLEFLFLLGQWDCRVIVEALRHQLKRQRILFTTRLFDFCPFVLEPGYLTDLKIIIRKSSANA